MHVLPETRYRFFRLIHDTYKLPTEALLAVIADKQRYSVRLRAAALRNLACSAPVSLTQGRCYLARRRIVRAHYGI
jgi:hypothetical protein